MTPDRRLDQLEPLMADSLQKTDRLIEGQGKLLDVATRAEYKADITDQKTDIIAKGVANLTVSTQNQFEELRSGQERIRQEMQEGFAKIIALIQEKP